MISCKKPGTRSPLVRIPCIYLYPEISTIDIITIQIWIRSVENRERQIVDKGKILCTTDRHFVLKDI